MSIITKKLFTLSFLLVVSGLCRGQDINDGDFKLTFSEYKVDSCLYDILEALVETDSAQMRFPADVYFYNLTYGNYIHYRDIIVRPRRWYKHLPFDTKGVVIVGGAKFVLMGRLDNDSLFKKTGNKIEISVNYREAQKFNKLDNKTKWLGWDKSPTALVGQVKFCGGSPIDLHVDVDKKVERLNLAGKQP